MGKNLYADREDKETKIMIILEIFDTIDQILLGFGSGHLSYDSQKFSLLRRNDVNYTLKY